MIKEYKSQAWSKKETGKIKTSSVELVRSMRRFARGSGETEDEEAPKEPGELGEESKRGEVVGKGKGRKVKKKKAGKTKGVKPRKKNRRKKTRSMRTELRRTGLKEEETSQVEGQTKVHTERNEKVEASRAHTLLEGGGEEKEKRA